MPPIEQATYLDSLQPAWPLGTDPAKDGDDHMRQVKQVLQNTFPGFTSALKTTSDNLNAITDHFHYLAQTPDVAGQPERMEAHNADWTASLPIAAATASDADYNANHSLLVTYSKLLTMMYPVGRYLITSNPADPATYLGFGTWAHRPGIYGGVGAITDSYGNPSTINEGWNPGFTRIHPTHLISQAVPFDLDAAWVPDHSHATAYSTTGGSGWSGGGEGQFEWGSQQTGGGGNHGHDVTGWVSLGAGDGLTGTAFTVPVNGVYFWERIG